MVQIDATIIADYCLPQSKTITAVGAILIKIAFYFYQVAELLTVGSTDNLFHEINTFHICRGSMFQYQGSCVQRKNGVPFRWNNSSYCPMAEVIIIYCVHPGFNTINHNHLNYVS